jgi:hypothetical protein
VTFARDGRDDGVYVVWFGIAVMEQRHGIRTQPSSAGRARLSRVTLRR